MPYKERQKRISKLKERTDEQMRLFTTGEEEPDTALLLEEISIYKAELEAQNDYLISLQDELSGLYNKFYNLFEQAPVAYMSIDLKTGSVLELNGEAEHIFGVERNQLINRPFMMLLDRESKQVYMDMTEMLISGSEIQSARVRFSSFSKGSSEAVLRLSLPPSENGDTMFYLAGIVDIQSVKEKASDLDMQKQNYESSFVKSNRKLRELNRKLGNEISNRRKAEQEYRKTRNLLEGLFNAIPDIMIVVDRDMNLLLSNWKSNTISTNESWKKIKCHNKLKNSEQECTECPVKKVLDSGSTVREELVCLSDMVAREVTAFPIYNEKNEIEAVAAHLRDISEKRRYENQLKTNAERYRTLAANIPRSDIILFDRELNLLTIEGKLSGSLGFDKRKYEGINIHELEESDLKDISIRLMNKAVNGEEAEEEVDYMKRKLHMHAVPVFTDEGTDSGVLIVRDVTEWSRQLEEHEKLIDELEHQNAQQEMFFYLITHDLRNPLLTINAFTGNIMKDFSEQNYERVSADLKRVRMAATDLQRLLSETIEYMQYAQFDDTEEEINLNEFVSDLFAQYRVEIDEGGYHIKIHKKMPVVSVNRQAAEKIFDQLIDNAFKFTSDTDNPEIEFGFMDDSKLFFIRDNGCGINVSNLEKVFRLFYQENPDTKGSGIGLSLVKRILNLQKQKIWIESDGEKKGVKVCFTLNKKSEII